MKEIQLNHKKVALVDDEDYEYLNQWKWFAKKCKCTWYPIRMLLLNNGKRKAFPMHKEIMSPPKGMETDHKDHNGLNCQKDNMRNCTRQQNTQNQRKQPNRSSKYKGVCWHKFHNKWSCRITLNGKTKHLGYFKFEIKAALAYNKAAKGLFGEFACLNIILNKRKESGK